MAASSRISAARRELHLQKVYMWELHKGVSLPFVYLYLKGQTLKQRRHELRYLIVQRLCVA